MYLYEVFYVHDVTFRDSPIENWDKSFLQGKVGLFVICIKIWIFKH